MQIGFINLLTLVFVAAKLFEYIDWSWWWVFSPTLISAGIVVAVLTTMLAAAVSVAVFSK